MERHNITETNKGLAYTLIAIGIILVLVTLANVIKAMVALEAEPFEWTSVLYFVQGLSLILMGIFQLRSRKYYIEWNKDEIRYRMPGNKEVESIRIADIKAIEIKLFEVELQLAKGEKVIDLEQAQFKSIRRIKERLEEIKSALS